MFEDSLIESGGKLKTKRGMTTVISFGFQVVLIFVLVLLPLLFTEALPKTQLMTFLVAPPPPPPPPPPPVRCHVPNVVGRSLGTARTRIARANCRVGTIAYRAVSRRRRGKVIGQNPHAGRNLPRNSRIHLLVGR